MMNILYPKGKFDVLQYYSKISQNKQVQSFLKDKELASKIWIPQFGSSKGPGFFIRRGSKDPALNIKDMSSRDINDKFFDLRKSTPREQAIENKKINKIQEKVWLYFPPNKCIDFFYATNGEGQGRPIERIFIDIDRENLSSEQARQVALELIRTIKSDKDFNKLVSYKAIILWTGSSFHIYLLLKKPQEYGFYTDYISYSKNEEQPSFITRWAIIIQQKTKIKVSGGHEKIRDTIILDPSGTPSGKLARVPFSLHYAKPAIKAECSIDGVCVPVTGAMLENKDLIKNLKALTPKKVLEEIDEWAENLK
jgi:hypothetical protein